MAKYQILPKLSTEEYESLRESIVNDGLAVPIEVDEKGDILDGHHRHAICLAENIEIRTSARVLET